MSCVRPLVANPSIVNGASLKILFLAAGLLLAGRAIEVRAATVELNFDPPAFQDGQVLAQVGDIGFFGNVKVFRPTGVATQSPPQALHTSQWCESQGCTNNASVISIGLRRRASEVSLRIGSEPPPANAFFCFPEGTDCGVYARLVGRDINNVIVQTQDTKLFDAGTMSAPITQELKITDPYGRISGVDLFVGRGTFSHDSDNNPGRVQIDNLRVTFPDAPPPPPPPPAEAPTITILQPSAPIAYPYRFTVAGTWTAPGGLYALCVRVNEPIPVMNLFCKNNTTRGPDTYTTEIYLPSLAPTGNVVNVAVVDLLGRKVTASRAFTPQPTPPPMVTLSSPAPGIWTPGLQPPLSVSGSTWVPGGVAGFCIRVARPSAPAPVPALGDCQNQNRLAFNGTYSGVAIDEKLLQPGPNDIWAYVFDAWGQMGKASVRGTVPANLRITGVEVTQGSQTFDAAFNSGPYVGVKLIKGVPTVVRVFANASVGGPFPGINATLEGFKPDLHAGEASLGILLPDNGRRALTAGVQLLLAERALTNGAYIFTLPASWTQNSMLRLRATVNNPAFTGTAVECATCRPDNVVDVTHIIFFDPLPSQTISPVNITWFNGAGVLQDPPSPSIVFADFATMAPMPPSTLTIRPYVTVINASKFETSAGPLNPNGITNTGGCDAGCGGWLFGLVAGFESSNQPGFTIGITTAAARGYTAPAIYVRWPTFLAWESVAIASTTFNVESLKLQVAHEVLHQWGFLHASGNCNAGGQLSTSWPPDFRGRLQGIGLDRRPGSGGSPGTYLVVVDQPAPLDAYDVMSYCAPGVPTRDWLSPRYWNAFGSTFTFGVLCLQGNCTFAAAPEPANAQPTYRALAIEREEGGWDIVDVRRSKMPNGVRAPISMGVFPTPPGPEVRFTARASDGRVIAIPASIEQAFDRGATRVATAEIPATDLRSISLEEGGTVRATRQASAYAPEIRMSQPVRLEPVADTRALRVAWTVADADRDPLTIRVEYSDDDGASFHPIGVTASRDGMELPKRLFSAANQARLRLVVTDGFNETQLITDAFKAEGDAPIVEIREPARDLEMLSTGTLNLAGSAFDDRGLLIEPGRVRWEMDGKALGTGAVAELIRPEPGRHVVTLTARDRLDREASAQRAIVVTDGDIEPTSGRDIWRVLLVLLIFALLLAYMRWRGRSTA